jgi:hypothetical protein
VGLGANAAIHFDLTEQIHLFVILNAMQTEMKNAAVQHILMLTRQRVRDFDLKFALNLPLILKTNV